MKYNCLVRSGWTLTNLVWAMWESLLLVHNAWQCPNDCIWF